MDIPNSQRGLWIPWAHNHDSGALPTHEHLSPRLREIARLEANDALAALGGHREGLTEAEASSRLEEHGPNTVAASPRWNALRQFAARLATPLNGMLLGLALISDLLGNARAAIVIAVMMVLSVGLSFLQEYRSNKAAEALRAMVRTTTMVHRRSAPASGLVSSTGTEIAIEQVVPGDIVSLSAGDMVPADLRILSAKDLFINQAALTGEALPCEKDARAADSRIRTVARRLLARACCDDGVLRDV